MAIEDTEKMTPQNVRTEEELCALDRDNIDSGAFWFIVSENSVSIGTTGSAFNDPVTIPKKDFDVFVKFYLEEQ